MTGGEMAVAILIGLLVTIGGALIVWLIKSRVERTEADIKEINIKTEVSLKEAKKEFVAKSTCDAREKLNETKFNVIIDSQKHQRDLMGKIFDKVDSIGNEQTSLSGEIKTLQTLVKNGGKGS